MDMSFYTGALGAMASQKKLDIVANNLANINNDGFKPKQAGFQELVNSNLHAPREEVTDLQADNGVAVVSTRTNFTSAPMKTTGSELDFAITDENSFFMLKDPQTGAVSYTRSGHFHRALMADGGFYLMTDGGKYVCGTDGNPIRPADIAPGGEADTGAANTGTDDTPGVFSLPYPSRLLNSGDNEWTVREGDTANTPTAVENPGIRQGMLEDSGTDMAREMTDLIEAQRAFSYALRMVSTSDEVEATINTLRS
jgi:flagellar basal-body rod protein FlgG